ncbi:MAG: hypothetical protein BGP04_24990 [Rhizobiales bacterium 62-17]|nr:MAG: hypothetical protein BGP04_24990 [Rhizobiales bacterium 62-17]
MQQMQANFSCREVSLTAFVLSSPTQKSLIRLIIPILQKTMGGFFGPIQHWLLIGLSLQSMPSCPLRMPRFRY